jgi:hypothetical protein
VDYKIKLDASGIKKAATATPHQQRARMLLQAAKEKTGRVTPTAGITANKELIASNKRLIDSNKALEKAVRTSAGGGGAGGGISGAAGAAVGGAAPGIGKIGASIPILGAGIAALGFTIQKINQVANAYIDLASQQLRSTAMGGFRRGRGIYGATEMGAGMGAYAKGTGQFAGNVSLRDKRISGALQVGTAYGMGAGEILGQAGTFQRAGGNLAQTAGMAAGGGIKADMPILLAGMAGMFEDAIRDGIDTTEMAKNLGHGLTALAMETPGKSVAAAMEIAKRFKGVKEAVAGGKVGGHEAMEVTQAGRDIVMEKLQDPNFLLRLMETKDISSKQAIKLSTLSKGAKFEDVQKKIGPIGAEDLLRKTVGETSEADILLKVIQNAQETWGKGVENRQKYENFSQKLGSSIKREQRKAAWDVVEKGLPESETKKGLKEIQERAKAVEGGPAGMAAKRLLGRQKMILDYGDNFAKASLKMEKSMTNLAKNSIDVTANAVNGLGTGIQSLIGSIGSLSKMIENFKNKSIWDLFSTQ